MGPRAFFSLTVGRKSHYIFKTILTLIVYHGIFYAHVSPAKLWNLPRTSIQSGVGPNAHFGYLPHGEACLQSEEAGEFWIPRLYDLREAKVLLPARS
jgi:hypothetical protein